MRRSAGIVALAALLALGGAAAGSPGATPSLPSSAAGARAPIRVVLDPGHGGSNAGALGVTMAQEKALTMVIARDVQRRLLAEGIDARLTRDADVTMTLRQRMEVANRWPADLFVSVHANASPTRTQRGYETYVLSPGAVDVDARALRSDSGSARVGVDPQTALVLDDLERGAAQWAAADLAADMQARLRAARGDAGDRGVRQDAQHVLLGATMPAVLVEVGFIDHPIEGRELTRPAVQAQLAEAIAGAIIAAARPAR
jgi:N-acetylmuramoyl-L-alanine amidase